MTERLRSQILPVRVSPEERRQLVDRAKLCDLALSTYVREAALGTRPRQRRGKLEQQAIYHLARVGSNLNQLARAANAMGRVELSRRLDEVLREIRRVVGRLV